MSEFVNFTISDFAKMTGEGVDSLHEEVSVSFPEFLYRKLNPNEEVEVEELIQSELIKTLRKSGDSDSTVWQKGWGEVLDRIKSKGISIENLRPQYYGKAPVIIRLNGEYVKVKDQDFEFNLYQKACVHYFIKYFSEMSHVIDFGCGTCTNQILLGQLFPKMRQTACDWSRPSQEIAQLISKEYDLDLEGVNFDLMSTNGSENISFSDGNFGIMTMHALEQTGETFKTFIDYLVRIRPSICFHMEPIVEFYNEKSHFDRAAKEYHLKRNYLNGLLGYLKKLETREKIEIIEEKRLGFGGIFHEAYSVIAWRVLE